MFNNNVLIFSVTDFCNARCKTCSFWKTEKAVFPRKEIIGKVIEVLDKKLDVKFLSLTGGEPLTYPHLFPLIKEAKKHGMIIQLMTNGSLLDKWKIRRLTEFGVSFIGFSVDHYNETVVYENRGLPNLLAQLKENVYHAKEAGILTQGGITIATHNIREIEKITDFALNNLLFDEVYFSLPINLPHSTYKLGNKDYDNINLSDAQLINAVDRMIILKEKYGNKISHRLNFLKDIKRFYLKEKQLYPCKAGEKIFFLDNHLDLYDCMVKSTRLGRITDDIHTLKNIRCYDCPVQCFREGSIYLNGLKSLPLFAELLFNKNYWKVIARKTHLTKFV